MQSRTTIPARRRAGRAALAVIALLVTASPEARAQASASTSPSVRLQPGTPGTQQSGHANISGTLRSGSVRTDWFRLGDSSTPGFVLTADASGIGTWQMPAASGLVLPFSGSASSTDPIFAVANTSTGPAIHGQHASSGQFGYLGSALAGVWGQGGTGVLGVGDDFGVRADSSGGIAVLGVHTSTDTYGLLGGSLYGVHGVHGPTTNYGFLGDDLYGAYGENAATTNRGHLGGPTHGAYGLSVDPTGAGVRGESTSVGGPAFGVHGSSISLSPAAAGVHAQGNGASPGGPPNAAALRVNNGAITVAGPILNRASGTIGLTLPAWFPINSCDNTFAVPPHFHPIGYYADEALFNNLIIPGPPNVGSMIMATVETFPGPPDPKTSYYVQVYAKEAGFCMFRVTRMGTPDPLACPTPGEITYIHYVIINPG